MKKRMLAVLLIGVMFFNSESFTGLAVNTSSTVSVNVVDSEQTVGTEDEDKNKSVNENEDEKVSDDESNTDSGENTDTGSDSETPDGSESNSESDTSDESGTDNEETDADSEPETPAESESDNVDDASDEPETDIEEEISSDLETGNDDEADTASENSEFSYTISDGTVTITGCTEGANTVGEVEIPSEIEEHTVVSIGSGAFRNYSHITKVVLPNTVTNISTNAFNGCIALESIDMDSVETIGNGAFNGCTALKTITIPNSVTTMGGNTASASNAVFGNSGLEKIIFKDGMDKIPDYACQYAVNLKGITIPDTVTEIGDRAFRGCSGLTSISLRNSIKTIGGYVFNDCTGLSDVTLGNSVETIGNGAFNGCTALKTITIPNSVIKMGTSLSASGPIFGDSGLEKIIFEDGMVKIPDYACPNAENLMEIKIPDTVSEIGKYAFYRCTSLKQINIFDGMTVGAQAFRYCTGIEDLKIGDNVKLDQYALADCTDIKALTLGKNLAIGKDAFENSTAVGTCGTDGDNLTWNYIISDSELTIDGSGAMVDYESADQVPWHSFGDAIEYIMFEGKITSIGSHAFQDCNGIESIILAESVTRIGEAAFHSCESLEYVELPSNLQTIGNLAFNGCNDLEEVVFCGDAPSLGSNCLPNITNLTIYIPELATGYTNRVVSKYDLSEWRTYDNTLPPNDVVLVLDTSQSMHNEMEQLKEAASLFVNEIGGARYNTKIAIVEYNDAPNVVETFSTDKKHLIKKIEQLDARRSTGYLAALNCADSLLRECGEDNKFVVMFSDGAPSDSATDIFSLAETMRENYEIYTVGLISNEKQRDVLINVAGREENYFEAANVNELVQAFQNLINSFGKSMDTTVEMKRNGRWVDLLAEEQKIVVGSHEMVAIKVTPGKKHKNVDMISLVQDGTIIRESTTGEFTNMQPGGLFRFGYDIYAVLYDSEGKVLEIIRLNITICDKHTVIYMYNNGTDNEYKRDYFERGDQIIEPDKPSRIGYYFGGWYSAETCTGYKFFDEENAENRLNLQDDITLYAKWTETQLYYSDLFSFTNNGKNFCASDFDPDEERSKKKNKELYYDYEISKGDYSKLKEELKWYRYGEDNKSEKKRVKENKEDVWGGSCFGMSAAVCLIKEGIIKISDFDSNVTEVWKASITPPNLYHDGDVGNIESMINYYHLMQYTDGIWSILSYFSAEDLLDENQNKKNQSSNLKNIVKKLKDSNRPAVLTVLVPGGGHAVVAYDFEEDPQNNTYTFNVYDCNKGNGSQYPVTITYNGGIYEAVCEDWNDSYKWDNSDRKKIFFKTVVTVEELITHGVLLKAPGMIKSYAANEVQNSTTYDLTTSYADFSITDGTNSAVITGGKLSKGELQIECFSEINESEYTPKYLFRLPVLKDGGSYIITSNSGADTYDTTMYYNDSSDGFFASESAEAPGTVTISSTGKVRTEYEKAVNHVISVTNNKMETPWYDIRIKGKDTSITVDAQSKITTVATTNPTDIYIRVESDSNYMEMNQEADAEGIEILSDQNNNVVIQKESTSIFSQGFGYSVVFDSQLGTSVDTLIGVETGTLIEEPNDPRRDGYTFQGWFKEEDCKNEWNFSMDRVTCDTILYAGWSINPNYFLSVTFTIPDRNNQKLTVPKGSKLDITSCPAIPEGMDQTWYTSNQYTKAWDFENDTVTKNIVLYAKGKGYKVTFETNGAEAIKECIVYAGNRIKKPADPVREGYIFTGWFIDSACEAEWDFYTDVVNSDMTLYAGWEEIKEETFAVSFNLQGHGKEDIADYINVIKGSTIPEPPEPSDDDYIFTGWYKDAECTQKWNFDTDKVESNLILYAGWSLVPIYTVTFDMQGHGESVADYTNIRSGSKIKEPDVPQAKDYVFTGWFKDAKCKERWDFDTDIVQSDITLYAGWVLDERFGDILSEDIPESGDIPDGIWSAGITDTVYTGSNITQSFRLYDGNKRLQEKADYTVSYKNNKTAYTYTEKDYASFETNLINTGSAAKSGSFDPKKAPQAIIKMKGNYSGSRIIYFRIKPADITGAGFITYDLAATYSGKKQTPAPTLTWNGKALKYGTDFYVPEYDNASNDKTAFSESKTYDLTIVGKNNFTGEIPITLTVSASNKQIAMSGVTVKGIGNQVWTGQQIKPEGYTVKYKTDVLSEANAGANGDYTISLGENTAVGTGTVILTGTGVDNDGDGYSYIGTKVVPFKITGTAMSKVAVAGVDKSYTYTGEAIEPNATLTYKVNKNASSVTLVKDTHYTATYQKNQDKGTATIIFTGLESGGYTGTKKTTFKIAASGIGDSEGGGNQFSISFKDAGNVRNGVYAAPYMKGGAKPEISVASGDKTLVPGKDYTVSYANNKKAALSTDKKAPAVTVKGKGNYSGSKKVTFSIIKKPLSEENGITVVAKDKAVSTKKNGYRQSFAVYDADGKKLGSSDYDTKTVIYTLIRTKDEDGTVKTVNDTLGQDSIVPADSEIRITVEGKGNYAGGSVSGTYRILKANHDISKATIQINNQEYTGQPVMITDQSQFKSGKVYIKLGGEKKVLTLGEDIEAVPDSYVKNINKGTAKVTFRGINDFGGTKTVSYKIGARSIADFWKGIFGRITGLMSYNRIQPGLPEQKVIMV